MYRVPYFFRNPNSSGTSLINVAPSAEESTSLHTPLIFFSSKWLSISLLNCFSASSNVGYTPENTGIEGTHDFLPK